MQKQGGLEGDAGLSPEMKNVMMAGHIQKLNGETPGTDFTVSVIIPCKNERQNIEEAARRIPSIGKGVELLFCDDRSTDGTAEEIQRVQKLYPEKDIRLIHGPGISKAKNVWTGFEAASGDILMILDADLTVMPEELPLFYHALAAGQGDLINGTRMILPMEKNAMPLLNRIGNRFFACCFSFMLGQRITDTLCGTKVFFRRDWHKIKGFFGSWGADDLWGDFDLLFSAAKMHLRILEVSVHYQCRTYGRSKMENRLLNGLIMLRMCLSALIQFKFRRTI